MNNKLTITNSKYKLLYFPDYKSWHFYIRISGATYMVTERKTSIPPTCEKETQSPTGSLPLIIDIIYKKLLQIDIVH